ncbi:YtxH domain-containing protein [Fulvivirga sp. M361]|uniref:YtxH domain-containing protein n=1 Tax=Fulvivirga sp. M361 TaxID=2594266 RepID=UPI001179BC3B|nr:YtxH domain-containing protein [Fulvivirga sp. M361]TRX60529.1 YtxH domain-containing protein [Fulvivirga sp. M361]
MENNGLKIIGSLLLGTAVGAVVGLLTAPESGKKTRKKLDGETQKFLSNINQAVGDSLQTLKSSYQDVVSEVASNAKKHISQGEKKVP